MTDAWGTLTTGWEERTQHRNHTREVVVTRRHPGGKCFKKGVVQAFQRERMRVTRMDSPERRTAGIQARMSGGSRKVRGIRGDSGWNLIPK